MIAGTTTLTKRRTAFELVRLEAAQFTTRRRQLNVVPVATPVEVYSEFLGHPLFCGQSGATRQQAHSQQITELSLL
jgi:hypothetical protein